MEEMHLEEQLAFFIKNPLVNSNKKLKLLLAIRVKNNLAICFLVSFRKTCMED